MEINATHLVLICLTLTWGISPVTVYSAPTTVKEASPTSNTLVNKHKVTNKSQITHATNNNLARKTTLVDESRGLSAFFIFGIAINIIMAVTFGWWFSKEWRRSKKNKVEDR